MLFTGTGAMLNIICNLWLLPRIGTWGAVAATVVAYMVMALTIVITAQKIYPIPIRIWKLTASLFSMVIILGVNLSVVMPFILKLTVAGIFLGFSWLFLLSGEAKFAVINKIKLQIKR